MPRITKRHVSAYWFLRTNAIIQAKNSLFNFQFIENAAASKWEFSFRNNLDSLGKSHLMDFSCFALVSYFRPERIDALFFCIKSASPPLLFELNKLVLNFYIKPTKLSFLLWKFFNHNVLFYPIIFRLEWWQWLKLEKM